MRGAISLVSPSEWKPNSRASNTAGWPSEAAAHCPDLRQASRPCEPAISFKVTSSFASPMQRQQFAGPHGDAVARVRYRDGLSFQIREGFDLGTSRDKIERIAD